MSAALIAARRDPRLARQNAHAAANATNTHPHAALHNAPTPALVPAAPIAPNVFDIKPLERVTKRKNVITIDVRQDESRDPRRRDPRLDRRRERRRDVTERRNDKEKPPKQEELLPIGYIDKIADPRKVSKLPPIPKLNREDKQLDVPLSKRAKEVRGRRKRPERPDIVKDESSGSSPEKKIRNKKKLKEPVAEESKPDGEVVPFKELKNYHKERYMRRNREKSVSPERTAGAGAEPSAEPEPADTEPSSKIPIYVTGMLGKIKVCDIRVRISGALVVTIKYLSTVGSIHIACYGYVPLRLSFK